MIVAPCKGCEDRRVGCHSVCEKYKEFRAIRDDMNIDNAQNSVIAAYHYNSIAKQAKAWKLKKRK